MTQAPEVRDELQSDLGWALGVMLRAYAKGAGHVIAGVPGGPRGYQVLAAAASGAEGTQLALANKLGIDRTVMTYLLDDLEQAGLIERRPDPADRRARRIVATDAGRATMCELQGKLAHVESRVLSALDEAERELFRALLRRAATRVDEHDPLADACTVVDQFAASPTASAVAASTASAGSSPTASPAGSAGASPGASRRRRKGQI
ncbi:MarR family winged helix-turn-helix transcriptional regulator [Dactylosporangium sp. CA-152071]|uniref:MarR family winged helix-turn-helix transcriptional regulator n=1 Tax=Dactylosporangium sp. CA-152071 TaxID=3239933 RepID=UPI003D8B546E